MAADTATDTAKAFYVTTPIYYVNDSPHIGHAYTTLACDVLARFKRLDGFDVKLLTGTDEHGQKVEKAAEAAGVDPQSFTDDVSQRFRRLADAMNFSHDDFIRTTEARHVRAVQDLWTRIQERGHIYLGSYSGYTPYGTRRSTVKANWSKRTARRSRRAARLSNGSKSRAISSTCPNGRTSFWRSTRRTQASSRPKAAGTR